MDIFDSYTDELKKICCGLVIISNGACRIMQLDPVSFTGNGRFGLWDGGGDHLIYAIGQVSCQFPDTIYAIFKHDALTESGADIIRRGDLPLDANIIYLTPSVSLKAKNLPGNVRVLYSPWNSHYIRTQREDHRSSYTEKINKMCWRGQHSNNAENAGFYPRGLITEILDKHPNCDVKFAKPTWDPAHTTCPNRMPQSEQSKYKSIMTIDGGGFPGNLEWVVLSGCVPVIYSKYVTGMQKDMVPWTHYVPVSEDLSDLETNIEWIFKNDAKCETILKNLLKYTDTNLSINGIMSQLTSTMTPEPAQALQKKVWYAPNKFESYGEEEIKAVEECLRDGWLAGFGPRTVEFERRVSALFGKKHGLFVNSGSSAILLALCSLNLPKGAEVITPACGFNTTVAPIVQLGLTPVFCDVQPDKYVPSVEQVSAVFTEKTAVLLLPSLIGNTPDWDALRAKFPHLVIIEDSADTITDVGKWASDIATTSFYASHVITAGGVGGMVMFNNEAHLKRATMFRDWGRIGDNAEEPSERFNHSVDGIPYDWKFLYGVCGYHLKACEMNAAFGNAQLDKLSGFLAKRRANIERYLENLKDTKYYTLPDDSRKPNWLAIPLQCPDRLELLVYLEQSNIQTRVCFSGNITRHPAFEEYKQEFAVSDTIMRDGFLLGAHHGMSLDDVDYVCYMLTSFENYKKKC